MKKQILIYGISAALVGCAGHYKRPESFESKMARYKSKSAEINKVPDMKVQSEFSYQKTRRGPASVGNKKKDLYLEHTNKKLYFLTLFSQYSDLSKFSTAENVPAVNICPSFHSILVDHRDKFEAEGYSKPSKVSLNFEKKFQSKNFDETQYPELSLPVTKEHLHPTAAEYLTSNSSASANEVMSMAIDVHLSKTYEELKELCDSGTSNNYYIYENLITHIKKQGFRPNSKNMKTLLKTSLFTNMALIKSLDKAPKKRGRGIASAASQPEGTYSDAVINRLGVQWSSSYFENLK